MSERLCIMCLGVIDAAAHRARLTCSDTCAAARAIQRAAAHAKRMASTEKGRAAQNARAKRAREKAAATPEGRARKKSHDAAHRKKVKADPIKYAKKQAYSREWSSATRERRKNELRAYLDGLTPEQLARWMDRQKSYHAAYMARWRKATPERHRSVLDRQTEWRRRAALLRLMSDAVDLEHNDA